VFNWVFHCASKSIPSMCFGVCVCVCTSFERSPLSLSLPLFRHGGGSHWSLAKHNPEFLIITPPQIVLHLNSPGRGNSQFPPCIRFCTLILPAVSKISTSRGQVLTKSWRRLGQVAARGPEPRCRLTPWHPGGFWSTPRVGGGGYYYELRVIK
jgi:hypothetical protein